MRLELSTTHHLRVVSDEGWVAASCERRKGEGKGSRGDATHTRDCGGPGSDFLNFDPGLYSSSTHLQPGERYWGHGCTFYHASEISKERHGNNFAAIAQSKTSSVPRHLILSFLCCQGIESHATPNKSKFAAAVPVPGRSYWSVCVQ